MSVRTCFLCEATSAGAAVTFRKKRDICDWCWSDLAARGLAWCAKGQHKVAASDMAAGKPRCRACARRPPGDRSRAAYAKAWRAQNREKVAAYAQRPEVKARKRTSAYDRYWRDPEAARARFRFWQRTDSRRAYRRIRYWQQPDAERARSRARYQRDKVRAWLGIMEARR